jgi:hypothetical protein
VIFVLRKMFGEDICIDSKCFARFQFLDVFFLSRGQGVHWNLLRSHSVFDTSFLQFLRRKRTLNSMLAILLPIKDSENGCMDTIIRWGYDFWDRAKSALTDMF